MCIFQIAINGQHFAEFPQRISPSRINHLAIDGDVALKLISYEGGAQEQHSQSSAPVQQSHGGYGQAPPQQMSGYGPPPPHGYGPPPPQGYGQPPAPPGHQPVSIKVYQRIKIRPND